MALGKQYEPRHHYGLTWWHRPLKSTLPPWRKHSPWILAWLQLVSQIKDWSLWPLVVTQARDINMDAVGPWTYTWTSSVNMSWGSRLQIPTWLPKVAWTTEVFENVPFRKWIILPLDILSVAQNQGDCATRKCVQGLSQGASSRLLHTTSMTPLCFYHAASQSPRRFRCWVCVQNLLKEKSSLVIVLLVFVFALKNVCYF